jgi:hypothetical protein
MTSIASSTSGAPRDAYDAMNIPQTEFLNWKSSPARLNVTQAAWFLGFEPHEIPILIAACLLKPLGHPARNATKFFATESLGKLRQDEKWLARASDAICEYWRQRNARNRSREFGANGIARFNRRNAPNGQAGSPTKATATG